LEGKNNLYLIVESSPASFKGLMIYLAELKDFQIFGTKVFRAFSEIDYYHFHTAFDYKNRPNWKLYCLYKYFKGRIFHTYLPSISEYRSFFTKARKEDIYFFYAFKNISARKWRIWKELYKNCKSRKEMIEKLKPYLYAIEFGRKESE
jgi:hypothetical protein